MTTSTQANKKTHTLSVLMNHNMNAFSRIIGIFSGKGFEMDSVSFRTDNESGIARITLTTSEDKQVIKQITKQLNKMVNVVKVENLTCADFMKRELALIKVTATAPNRAEVMQIAQIFQGNIVDVSPQKISVEIAGNREKVAAAIRMFRFFGIAELAQTSSVALLREHNEKT